MTVPRLGPPPAWARGLAARGTAPEPTGPAQFEAANRFERLAAELLDAAARELHVRSLGAALTRTSRQLHTLEHKVAPALRNKIATITPKASSAKATPAPSSTEAGWPRNHRLSSVTRVLEIAMANMRGRCSRRDTSMSLTSLLRKARTT